jgi:hypothetical protein
MDDIRLKRLENKIDHIAERISSVDKTLVKQHEQLAHHIYRTGQNELMIEKMSTSMVPIKSHVVLMNNIAKIIVFLGVLAAIYKNLGM